MSVHHARNVFDAEDATDDGNIVWTATGYVADGFHLVDLEDESRPEDGLTYSEDELIARYREVPSGRATIICGWCNDKHESRDVKKHLAWFRTHDCNINHAQAAENARIIAEAKAAERESLRQVAAAA